MSDTAERGDLRIPTTPEKLAQAVMKPPKKQSPLPRAGGD